MGRKKWDREAGDHCFDLINLIDLDDSLNYVLYNFDKIKS